MREQKRKEINGITYLVTQMSGTRALRVQTKLVSLLGKGIFEILGKGKITKDSTEMLEALAPILDNFDDEKAFNFVMYLFEEGVFIEKKDGDVKVPVSIDFEKDFIGKVMDMWKVVGFILEANFATGK